MKTLAVISGLVVLVIGFFGAHHNRLYRAGTDLIVEPVAGQPTRIEPSAETAAGQPIFLPLVQKTLPPLSETLKQKYLLVEHWTTEEWGSHCPGLIIDFPTYYFDGQTGQLFITSNPALPPTTMGYLGYGVDLLGAGVGISSSLSGIEAIPYTVSDTTLQAISATGQITITHKNEVISLSPGTAWVSKPSVESEAIGLPNCVVTTTHRLTNFGFQERSQIIY